jgi:ParB/RepB/Spo0J family partition protein
MPKLNATNTLTFKISISQIKETGNVRQEYDPKGIAELADSIFTYGLINPITVKPLENDENGIKQYELVAGHRRLRAFQYLCEKGRDYTQITASVITKGSKDVLQLVENIQREELAPIDIETALKAMVTAGMSQKQISEELSKSLSWVHDRLTGNKVRAKANAQGIKTDGMSSKALSQFGSIPDDKLPGVISNAQANGGTVKAATDALNDYRSENNIEPPKNNKQPESLEIPEFSDPEPIKIDIETVISEIQDYFSRQLKDEESPHRINTYTKIKDDLLALFEAYQHN